MRYIWRNIRSFARKDTFLFLLVILSVATSAVMIHFAYGLFQNYQLQKTYNLTGVKDFHVVVADDFEELGITEYYGEKLQNKAFLFISSGKTKEYVTVGMLEKFVSRLGDVFGDAMDYMKVYPVVEGLDLECGFRIQNGKLVNSEMYQGLFNSNYGYTLSRGRNFTEQEYQKGEKVAICWDLYSTNVLYKPDGTVVTNSPITEHMMIDDNTLLLQGEKYRIIGFGEAGGKMERPIVPVTALENDTPLMDQIDFYFNKSITLEQYLRLEREVERGFGDLAIMQPLELPTEEELYLYNTIIGIAILISLVSALDFAILYRYILTKRKKDLMVYRICGLTFWGTVRLYLTECMAITLPIYLTGTGLFAKFILPAIAKQYEYMHYSFSYLVYGCLFFLYYGVSLLVLLGMILFCLKKDDKLKVRGGYQ